MAGERHWDEVDPGLPIKLGWCSNGEWIPPLLRPVTVEAMRRARAEVDRLARRAGMSRRRFLLSSMGAAAGLLALGACSEDESASRGESPGGTFSVPPEASSDRDAATEALAGDAPILDVQTHLLDYDAVPDAAGFGNFPFGNCGEDDPRQCFGVDHWLEEIFLRSDTDLVVLSALPIVGDADPLSIEVMERARAVDERLCGDNRVLLQGHAVPNIGIRADSLDAMDRLAAEHAIAAWKVYTHAPRPGWSFTDDTGRAFLERVEVLATGAGGPGIVSVHKGLSGGDPAASPEDIGPAALEHPAVDFVVYHSGYEGDEGPYDPDGGGVDRLVRSLADAGLAAGGNVYAELGSTWRSVMGDPDQAAHTLGKLLAAVGEDNVVWGTDSIWYGSPQDQIQAFRTFEISTEYQERFGYPALTPASKAKILGANAARLYGVETELAAAAADRCQYSEGDLELARQESALGNRTYGPAVSR